MERDSKVVGSALTGQEFTDEIFPRPVVGDDPAPRPSRFPGDLVTTSVSAPRVAKARYLPENRVRQLVAESRRALRRSVRRAARQRAPTRLGLDRAAARWMFRIPLLPGVIAGLIRYPRLVGRPLPAMHNPQSKSGEGMITRGPRSGWIAKPNDDASRKRTMYCIVNEKCSSSFRSSAKSRC